MKKSIFTLFLSSLICISAVSAQVPLNVSIQILKAEDARRYDGALEKLLSDPNPAVRKRAALAAGRIGDDRAVASLLKHLQNDSDFDVSAIAAFALGEIESIKAADGILAELGEDLHPVPRPPQSSGIHIVIPAKLARLVEAAGKIAAANPKDEKAKALGDMILDVLRVESGENTPPDTQTIRLALTAALRAHPAGADEVVRKFLAFTDPAIVGDALNTLTRLKAKNANRDARDLLATSVCAVVRANAARVLGAAEDKDALDILLKAATTDQDSRVRVSAIRALGSLKDAKATDKLLEYGEKLLVDYQKSKFRNPVEKNELLEISTVLGRLLANSNNERAIKFLTAFRIVDQIRSPETEMAFAEISPEKYLATEPLIGNPAQIDKLFPRQSWRSARSLAQGLAEIAHLPDEKKDVRKIAMADVGIFVGSQESHTLQSVPAVPDYLQAYVAFKADINSLSSDSSGFPTNHKRDLVSEMLRGYVIYKEKNVPAPFRIVPPDNRMLGYNDPIVRATAAELLADQPTSEENIETLKKAFDQALLHDKDSDDAQLAIMDALYKLDKKESVGTLLVALGATDYLVRKKAFELLSDKDLQKDFPGIPTSLENARVKHKDQVLPYSPAFGTKLGQVLNTDLDYRRALSRKNGTVKAILTTEKGTFTIDLLPEDAPLTVDNFIKLARANYFNGVEVHRVVPNFVMQDGDPRGDGNGGPGWSIRCEINMIPYERGAVGMALSGKDTGGSQWFVTHSPQPHLDGGYTVFGKVNETGMKIVDNIVRGDKILSVKIIERNSPRRR